MKYEIKCPNCGQMFEVDESKYNQLLSHIKNEEIDKAVKLELNQFNLEKEIELAKLKEQYNQKIQELESLNKTIETDSKTLYEKKIGELNHQLAMNKKQSELDIQLALSKKEEEISKLKNQLDNKDQFFNKEKENIKLNNDLDISRLKEEIESLNSKHQQELKDKDDQIAQLKDFKIRLSTKMVGESLEVHCLNEFNKIRSMFTSNNIYFEKDNQNIDGSKGDFIYKETTSEGVEVLSIMFEMKNENETTATKHKNEDFLKELDKDRNNKNCEYAILVSMLEADNDYYNNGIVDVSYRYPKMYVIRPQFFIPIITLLRNAALKNLNDKIELEKMRSANLDITRFEDKLDTLKDGFNKHYASYEKHSQEVIRYIDDTISKLNKVKDEILISGNQLRLANNDIMDITIKKLTYGNKTMQEKFKELKGEENE